MRIYLAGPMAGCTDAEATGWREIAHHLFPADIICDPMRRDYRHAHMTHKLAQQIVADDKAVIASCDVVVANFWKPSTGTAMEVFYAYMIGKWIVSVANDPVSPWITQHSNRVVRHMDEVPHAVRQSTLRD